MSPFMAASWQGVDECNMHGKRSCAKHAAVKARMAARNEEEDDDV